MRISAIASLLLALLLISGCGIGMRASFPSPRPMNSSMRTESFPLLTSVSGVPGNATISSSPGSGLRQDEAAADPATFSVTGLPREVAEAISGVSWTQQSPVALDELSYVLVTYLDFEGEAKEGALIVHRELAQEVADIFAELYEARFPIAKIRLIDEYGGDDELSMADNNTYGFCTRQIVGTDRLSRHSYGIAIDINPVQNPYIRGGTVSPEQAAGYLERGDVRPGMIVRGDDCHTAFVSRGWSWGGEWASPDYQHFEKPLP